MIEIFPLDVEHFGDFVPQIAQADTDMAILKNLIGNKYTFAILKNKKPIAYMGLICIWENRYMAWSVLSEEVGPYLLWITRRIKEYLENFKCYRIETYLNPGFGNSIQWARLLGFKYESLAQKFNIDGGNSLIYCITKD